MEVEKDEVGVMLLRGSDGAVRIVGRRDDPISRIVFDQIFECVRQLKIVFNHKDPEHPRAPLLREKKFFPENP
jgi:hypothetical protein